MRTFIKKIPHWLFIGIIGLSLLLILGLFLYGIFNQAGLPDWVGTNPVEKRTGTDELIVQPKTLWDLVDLLLVPFVLAGGGYLFNHAQQKRDQAFAEAQNTIQQKIALDRAQEQELQNYMSVMSDLIINRELLRTDDEVILNLARSRTLTILRSLNNPYLDIKGKGKNRRKASLARFLYEMGVISGGDPVISLRKANLEYAYMHGGEFKKANFAGTYMKQADLRNSVLRKARMENVHLQDARLNNADLTKADLRGAKLQNADLSGAILTNATLTGANLSGAILRGADLTGVIKDSSTIFAGALMPDESIGD
jgi:uncharacterized protein YjbI with pentapeptide repeats